MDVGSERFIVFLLYLHNSWGISVNICIAEFQSQDAFDFILALSYLGGLVDECAGKATWFDLSQACLALC